MRARRILVVAAVLTACSGLASGCGERARRGQAESEGVQAQTEPAKLKAFEAARHTRAFDLGGAEQLTIENRFGDVQVRPGGRQVEVEAIVYALGTDAADARNRAADVAIEGGPDPEAGLRIVARAERKSSEVRVDLGVLVPPEVALLVQVVPGEVEVSGLKGPVEIRGQSGDITATDSKGSVTVESTLGNIRVARATAGASAHSGSGNIVVEEARGSLLARSMSGAIAMSDVRSDSITATTSSGSIDIRLGAPFAGEMLARTDGGSIRIALAAASDCRIRTATDSGEISCALPLQAARRQGRNISGQLGRGRGLVDVATRSGNITVVEAE